MIEISDLRFSYPDGTPALKGVDLCVPEGCRMGLVGCNGAGKSTLLWHLNGLLEGTGDVAVAHMAVSHGSLKRLRQRVGLVFQNPDDQLFMPTVFDEVAYAAVNAGFDPGEVTQRTRRALELVGMSGVERRHPINLSTGQKKRVAIASVMVTDNELLVLDEPSAGLDPAGRRDLISLLRSLDRTMVIASHDLSLVEDLCDRVAVMLDGRVARTGPTAELLADAELLAGCGL